MLNIVVPLAGPDYFQNGIAKGLLPFFKHKNSLKYILESRPWFSRINTYHFILLRTKESELFYEQYLNLWFPNNYVYYMDSPAAGAALTVISSISNILDLDPFSLFIVDLADIYFKSTFDPTLIPKENLADAYFLGFESNLPIYSYAEVSNSNRVLGTIEKKVISNHASAGVYIFKNVFSYLEALSNLQLLITSLKLNGNLFVCPVLNGLTHKYVVYHQVHNVQDVKST